VRGGGGGRFLWVWGGGYPEIPLLQFAGVGGGSWYHEERSA